MKRALRQFPAAEEWLCNELNRVLEMASSKLKKEDTNQADVAQITRDIHTVLHAWATQFAEAREINMEVFLTSKLSKQRLDAHSISDDMKEGLLLTARRWRAIALVADVLDTGTSTEQVEEIVSGQKDAPLFAYGMSNAVDFGLLCHQVDIGSIASLGAPGLFGSSLGGRLTDLIDTSAKRKKKGEGRGEGRGAGGVGRGPPARPARPAPPAPSAPPPEPNMPLALPPSTKQLSYVDRPLGASDVLRGFFPPADLRSIFEASAAIGDDDRLSAVQKRNTQLDSFDGNSNVQRLIQQFEQIAAYSVSGLYTTTSDIMRIGGYTNFEERRTILTEYGADVVRGGIAYIEWVRSEIVRRSLTATPVLTTLESVLSEEEYKNVMEELGFLLQDAEDVRSREAFELQAMQEVLSPMVVACLTAAFAQMESNLTLDDAFGSIRYSTSPMDMVMAALMMLQSKMEEPYLEMQKILEAAAAAMAANFEPPPSRQSYASTATAASRQWHEEAKEYFFPDAVLKLIGNEAHIRTMTEVTQRLCEEEAVFREVEPHAAELTDCLERALRQLGDVAETQNYIRQSVRNITDDLTKKRIVLCLAQIGHLWYSLDSDVRCLVRSEYILNPRNNSFLESLELDQKVYMAATNSDFIDLLFGRVRDTVIDAYVVFIARRCKWYANWIPGLNYIVVDHTAQEARKKIAEHLGVQTWNDMQSMCFEFIDTHGFTWTKERKDRLKGVLRNEPRHNRDAPRTISTNSLMRERMLFARSLWMDNAKEPSAMNDVKAYALLGLLTEADQHACLGIVSGLDRDKVVHCKMFDALLVQAKAILDDLLMENVSPALKKQLTSRCEMLFFPKLLKDSLEEDVKGALKLQASTVSSLASDLPSSGAYDVYERIKIVDDKIVEKVDTLKEREKNGNAFPNEDQIWSLFGLTSNADPFANLAINVTDATDDIDDGTLFDVLSAPIKAVFTEEGWNNPSSLPEDYVSRDADRLLEEFEELNRSYDKVSWSAQTTRLFTYYGNDEEGLKDTLTRIDDIITNAEFIAAAFDVGTTRPLEDIECNGDIGAYVLEGVTDTVIEEHIVVTFKAWAMWLQCELLLKVLWRWESTPLDRQPRIKMLMEKAEQYRVDYDSHCHSIEEGTSLFSPVLYALYKRLQKRGTKARSAIPTNGWDYITTERLTEWLSTSWSKIRSGLQLTDSDKQYYRKQWFGSAAFVTMA